MDGTAELDHGSFFACSLTIGQDPKMIEVEVEHLVSSDGSGRSWRLQYVCRGKGGNDPWVRWAVFDVILVRAEVDCLVQYEQVPAIRKLRGEGPALGFLNT